MALLAGLERRRYDEHRHRRHGVDQRETEVEEPQQQHRQHPAVRHHKRLKKLVVTRGISLQMQEALHKQNRGHPRKDANEVHQPHPQPRRAVQPQQDALVPLQKQLRTGHPNQEQRVQQVASVSHGEVQDEVVQQHDRHDAHVEGVEQVPRQAEGAQFGRRRHAHGQQQLLACLDAHVHLEVIAGLRRQRKLGVVASLKGAFCTAPPPARPMRFHAVQRLPLARSEHHQGIHHGRGDLHPGARHVQMGQVHLHPRPRGRVAQGGHIDIQSPLGAGFEGFKTGVGRRRGQLDRMHVAAEVVVAGPRHLGPNSLPHQAPHRHTAHPLQDPMVPACRHQSVRFSRMLS